MSTSENPTEVIETPSGVDLKILSLKKSDIISERGGLVEPLVPALLNEMGGELNMTMDLIEGFYKYFKKHQLIKNPEDLMKIFEFFKKFSKITNNKDLLKARSFNYLYGGKSLDVVLDQILKNAELMIKYFGTTFFGREPEDKSARDVIWRTRLDDGFNLTCKGGSGAGAISADFAFAIDKGGYMNGELWRTGFDTETSDNGLTVRIIRTGTAMKKDTNTNYEEKSKKFDEFKRKFGCPSRLLAFLCMYIAYDMGADRITALSTEGAKKLSSLNRSKSGFDYSELFLSTGFSASKDPNFLVIDDLQSHFYDALRTTRTKQNGLRSHEASGLHDVLTSINRFSRSDGDKGAFPLKVCRAETKEELEKAIREPLKNSGFTLTG